VQASPSGHNGRVAPGNESDAHDGDPPYSPEKLIEMDACFVARVQAAFEPGTENPAVAKREAVRGAAARSG
jgi:hypothetical protein